MFSISNITQSCNNVWCGCKHQSLIRLVHATAMSEIRQTGQALLPCIVDCSSAFSAHCFHYLWGSYPKWGWQRLCLRQGVFGSSQKLSSVTLWHFLQLPDKGLQQQKGKRSLWNIYVTQRNCSGFRPCIKILPSVLKRFLGLQEVLL